MQKVAIITGSSRGIGLAILKALARDGYATVMTATGSEEKHAATLASLRDEGHNVLYIQADVSKSEDRESLVEKTVEHFGRIDVLVNNAGVAPLERKDLLEMTEDSFDRVLAVNAKATMFLTQLAAKAMIAQRQYGRKKGVIVNISSCSAAVSSTSRGEYCVSKAAMSMLTTLFADRLAGEGILVHEVRPGIIATDMTSAAKAKYDRLIEEGLFPIRRWGEAGDVAEAVSALVSDKFLYTTGNHIDIDGGFHIKRL